MLIKIKGLNRVRKWLAKEKRWEDYVYPWKGESAPRLEGKEGSAEFIASYIAAIASRGHAATTFKNETLGWLIEEKFCKSQHFKKLGERTLKDYKLAIPSIENHFGDFPLEALKNRRTRAIFVEWRDSIASGTCETLVLSRPSRRPTSDSNADMYFQKLSAILSWGFKQGWIDNNPCTLVGPLNRSSRLYKVWSWEQEAVWLCEARKDLVEAYLIDVWLGPREGDLVALLWSDYDGTYVRYQMEKRPRPGATPKWVCAPVGGPLKLVLDAMEREAGLDGVPLNDIRRQTPILLNSQGRPWANGHAFYGAFHWECIRLGIEDRTFHDLRRTAVLRLAIADCTVPQIASITGHSMRYIETLQKHYLPLLDPALAIAAIRKLENSTLHFYAQFVRQFLERRLEGSKSSAERPTERPTDFVNSLSVLSGV